MSLSAGCALSGLKIHSISKMSFRTRHLRDAPCHTRCNPVARGYGFCRPNCASALEENYNTDAVLARHCASPVAFTCARWHLLQSFSGKNRDTLSTPRRPHRSHLQKAKRSLLRTERTKHLKVLSIVFPGQVPLGSIQYLFRIALRIVPSRREGNHSPKVTNSGSSQCNPFLWRLPRYGYLGSTTTGHLAVDPRPGYA